MPETIMAGNWKMYKTVSEAIDLVSKIKNGLGPGKFPTVVVCPPFTDLGEIGKLLKSSNIKLGAQNFFWEKEGAYTGEISGRMLVESGCQFVIIGHSERRIHFGEQDIHVNCKIKQALVSGLRPIVCCGEKLEEREKGEAKTVVERQIRGAYNELKPEEVLKTIIAYEPVWAIGTGKTATPGQAQEMHQFIRKIIAKLYSAEVSSALSILYGGSVKPDNIKNLMAEKDINGALVGGASLDPGSFLEIIKYGGNK